MRSSISRGDPTVEVDCVLESGAPGQAIVPREPRPALRGRPSCGTATSASAAGGSARPSRNVRGEIAAAVDRREATRPAWHRPRLIDLDGTPNKSRLGANAILGVPSRWPRRPPTRSNSPLSLRRWRERGRLAGSDDERHQRRTPCRQQHRFPGVHDRAARRGIVLRGASLGCRDVSRR